MPKKLIKGKTMSIQLRKVNKNTKALYESLAYVRDEEYYSYNVEV